LTIQGASQPKGPVQANTGAICSDLAANVSVTKTLAGGNGIVTLNGSVCNVGPVDYKGTQPLDAYFMVYTWHPPKTPAQEGDVKIFSHNAVGPVLKAGECRPVTQTYTIPGVAAWDFPPTIMSPAGVRQAVKQFALVVEKKYPMKAGDTSFSKNEDCSSSNNAASQDVPYMEKVQSP
jgi:hypothetical protein